MESYFWKANQAKTTKDQDLAASLSFNNFENIENIILWFMTGQNKRISKLKAI